MVKITFNILEALNLQIGPVRIGGRSEPEGVVPPLVQRWLWIWKAHGVHRHQIPSLLNSWSGPTSALLDPGKLRLIDRLSDAMLSETCTLFNISRSWLEDGEDEPYGTLTLSKRHVGGLIDTIVRLKRLDPYASLIVLRSGRREIGEQPQQYGCLVFRAAIGAISGGEREVDQYVPVYSLRHWDCPQQAFLALRAMWVACRLGMQMMGYTADRRTIEAIADGRVFPGEALRSARRSWHPDDYVYSLESAVVKRPDWLSEILADCQRTGIAEQVQAAKVSVEAQRAAKSEG